MRLTWRARNGATVAINASTTDPAPQAKTKPTIDPKEFYGDQGGEKVAAATSRSKPMSNLKALLGGVAAVGIAVATFGDVVRRWLRFRAARGWTETTGRITESCLYRDPERNDMINFRVNYQFETFSGEVIIGTTPRLCGNWFWSQRAQQEFVDRFTTGDEVNVYYDPAAPHRNCLDRRDGSSFWAQSCTAIIMATIGGLLVWMSE
jgi:hypothetical protein